MTVTAEAAEVLKPDIWATPRRWMRNQRAFAWALIGPCLLFLVLVGLYPTIYVFALSFSKYTPGQVDTKWTDAMEAEFQAWAKARRARTP
mgnify:CR=1 FL=1